MNKFITKTEFLKKVREEITPLLYGKEKERKTQLLLFLFIPVVISLALFIIFRNYLFINEKANTLLIVLFSLPIVFGYFKISSYIKKQKSIFMPILLKSFGDIKVIDKLPISTIINSKITLFKNSFNENAETDDCLFGEFNETVFAIKEISFTRGSGKRRVRLFDGFMINIPMTKEIKSHSLIFNSFFPSILPAFERTTIEDPKFSKKFKIYTNNQIEIRKILTPAFIERLYVLKEVFSNHRIDMAFFDNQALFAIHTTKDMFEPYSIFRSAASLKPFSVFYDEIKAIYDMVKILNIKN